MAEDNLPPLPKVSIPNADRLEAPSLKIRTEEDVTTWKSTKGYQNYMLFLRRLSESVVGRSLPQSEQECGNNTAVWNTDDLRLPLDSSQILLFRRLHQYWFY